MTLYLDYAASTPVDPAVAAVMAAALADPDLQGNPSATHAPGRAAAVRIEAARAQVAALIGARPAEILWTSGATEANNLAVLGAGRFRASRGRHVVTSSTEHASVVGACRHLEREGFAVTWLDPDGDGLLDAQQVAAALRPDTTLVSIMAVNNETGVVQDVAAIGAVCRARGVLFHVDAVQAAGREPLDVEAQQIDLLSISGHKFYGPKGAGALFVNGRTLRRVEPLLHGGGQERGLRPGTLATHQLVGLGLAAELAGARLDADRRAQSALREALWAAIARVPGVLLNGHRARRACHILNVSVEGVEGESLLLALDALAVSSGAACGAASGEPSAVLRRLGRSDALAQASIRFSVGRATTAADIDAAAAAFVAGVAHLRRIAPAAA